MDPPDIRIDQSIELADVTAGRDINVNPVIIAGDTSRNEFERAAANALIRSPVQDAGMEAEAKRAEELVASGKPGEAAVVFEEIGKTLSESPSRLIGEFYLDRAAGLFGESGENEHAAQLLLEVIHARLERFDSHSRLDTRELLGYLDDDEGWLGNGLLARSDWPEYPEAALQALNEAFERTRGTPDELEWAQALVELNLVLGEVEEAARVADDVRKRIVLDDKTGRVDLELGWLDASSRADPARDLASEWSTLLALTEKYPRPPNAVSARIWQHRGIARARKGDVEGARAAYLRAIEIWALERESGDFMKECFFSVERALTLSARMPFETFDVRTLASQLRSGEPTLVETADRLEHIGLNAHLREELYEARRVFWIAYGIHRRLGNLYGATQVARLLGDLHKVANRPDKALRFFIECGNSRAAAAVARDAGFDAVEASFSWASAQWELTAALSALGEVGALASVDGAAALAPLLIEVGGKGEESRISPQPAPAARRALAAMAISMPDPELEEALPLIRNELTDPLNASQAALALILLTETGRADETATLARAYVADQRFEHVSSVWIASHLAANSDARSIIRDAAIAGNDEALELLAIGELIEGDDVLATLVEKSSCRWLEVKTREYDSEAGEVAYHMINFASAGTVVAYASSDTRRKLIERLLAIIESDEEVERVRGSVADAFFNMSKALDPAETTSIALRLIPIAQGEFELTEIDRFESSERDPFSRSWVSFGPMLRKSALEATAVLSRRCNDVVEGLDDAVREASRAGSDQLLEAALNAQWHEPRLPLLIDLKPCLGNAAPSIRAAALRVLWQRDAQDAERELTGLARDPSPRVRQVGVEIALAEPRKRELLELFVDDPDSYLRSTAQAALANT